MRTLLIIILTSTSFCESLFANPEAGSPFIRGVTVSCRGNGRGEWDSPAMGRAIAELRTIGATSFSIHPYARINNDGSLRYNQLENDPMVLRPLADAKTLDMQVMLIPHIAYWGSKFKWRGEITFDTEQQWSRFFGDYAGFITHQAKLAEQGGAEIFCIGLEYVKTTHLEEDWRNIIEQVRKVYTGKITYAANWDNYQNIGFWDALDYIGVQAYFPVANVANPTEEQIAAGWDKHIATLCKFAKSLDKHVILTELGYAQSELAATQPWASKKVGDNGLEVKLRCMKIALERIEREPHIKGVYLWKWFVQERQRRGNFHLQFPEMRLVIEKSWAEKAPVGSCSIASP